MQHRFEYDTKVKNKFIYRCQRCPAVLTGSYALPEELLRIAGECKNPRDLGRLEISTTSISEAASLFMNWFTGDGSRFVKVEERIRGKRMILYVNRYSEFKKLEINGFNTAIDEVVRLNREPLSVEEFSSRLIRLKKEK